MNRITFLTFFILIGFIISNILKQAKEAHWAVLIAGSNGFWNYRHQSDTCHAYQILIKNGMPASRIITFAYDDIANSDSNPFPGKVFNKPDPTGNGVDVYTDCKLDYTGSEVTPEIFLNVLKGDVKANKGKGTGRVLQSTAEDKVFVYFTDHGATGLIAFPTDELMAEDLISTLKYMHDNSLYKKLVFYLEACESGSMFQKILPNNWEIYATTAANPSESSWATYCSPDDVVNGVSVGSCLGDEYSVNWMEDTEAATEDKPLQKQFEDVKNLTKGSHVQQYGVLTWTDESIRNYQGDVSEYTFVDKFFNKIEKSYNLVFSYFNKNKQIQTENYKKYLEKAKMSRVDSRDAKLIYLKNKYSQTKTLEALNAYNQEIEFREKVQNFFLRFDKNFGINNVEISSVSNFSCLRNSVKAFKASCMSLWDEYTLKYVKHLYAACEKVSADVIESYLKSYC
jgi:legumain